MYRVLDVCQYIIEYSNEKEYGISNLKLQKLLYFIQAEFLVETDEKCFPEKIIAWDFGPVVLEAYHKYKIYGSCQIFNPSINDGVCNLFTEDDRKRIKKIVDALADYSSTDLLYIIHHQSPWNHYFIPGMNNEIPVSVLKEYFSEDN